MSDPVIQVAKLAKRYRLGATQAVGRTFGEMLYGRAARWLGRPAPAVPDKDFWALRNISFEVHAGEVVGIIGRNGAGKSTLLKILSRITDPTEGRAVFRGRLASLLEVGTGFHPELTGRENIYLGGAVQGMRRHEIRAHFDEIVAFSGISKFLETPVKRYSSGMYVRLAFAVAAHLQADILLVDEVLAVGDAAFQEKCMGKMRDVATGGRTVLFVSHNMSAMRAMTQRCLYLSSGELAADEPTPDAIEHYLADNRRLRTEQSGAVDAFRRGGLRADVPIHISRIWANDRVEDVAIAPVGQRVRLNVELTATRPVTQSNLTIILKDAGGQPITSILSHDSSFALSADAGQSITVQCALDGLHLRPGDYLVDVGVNRVAGQKAWDAILDYPVLRVDNTGPHRLAHRPDRAGAVLCPAARWTTAEALRGAA